MLERIQKIIAASGYCSRRKAEELIKEQKVKVNGKIISLGFKVEPDKCEILIDNQPIASKENFVYFALNKPRGFTSTLSDPHAKKTVTTLVREDARIFPVGRLDKDSEGLIILTNDGEFANLLTHPKFEHEKEYAVLASYRKGTPREELLKKLEKMESGVMIEDKKTSPAKITLIKASNLIEFNIVIHEGRKRQIRQMCSSVGFNVERLTRIRIGKLELGELKSGKYRSISREEVV